MSKLEALSAATMEVRPPVRFSVWAMVMFGVYGFLLLLPALFSMLIVSSVPFNWWTYALPLMALAFATVLLPFGFGNTYATRLARKFKPDMPPGAEPALVQITFTPRLRSGLRSLMEDADDIGWLYWTDTTLLFHGDSVAFKIPFSAVRSVHLENSGFRSMFLYSRLRVETSVAGAEQFWMAERFTWSLPASRSAARGIHTKLLERVGANRMEGIPPR